MMKYYGIGLGYDGKHIVKNKRYISTDHESFELELLSTDVYKYDFFVYDIICGILRIHTLDLLKVIPDKNWIVADHFHSYYELHIIPRGKGTITIDGTTFPVGPRQFYLTAPYVSHAQVSDPDDPMEEYCLQFEIQIPENMHGNDREYQLELNSYRNILGKCYPCSFNDIYAIHSSFEQLFDEADRQQIAYELKIQTAVTDILIDVMRTVSNSIGTIAKNESVKPEEQDKRIDVIKKFVESNYANKISINDLKSILFLSTKQIDRIMLKHCNMTFHNYLLRYRFEMAKKLISTTQFSLIKIAAEVGLSSEGHLHKLFKSFHANPPGYYRKKNS